MRKTVVVWAALVALLAGGLATAIAQEPPLGTKRPKIMQIYVEEVKPGRQAAHAKSEAGWPAALRKANNKGYYLAIGNGREAWFLNPFATFAAIESQSKADEADAALTSEIDRLWAVDGEMLTKTGAMTVVLNEDLGYRADWDTAKQRYYAVTVVRIQPGYGSEYTQIRKLVNAAHDKAKVDERWATYEVVTGAPDETYIFFSPLASLAEWDKYDAMHGKEYQEALGEDGRNRMREFNRNAVKGSETKLLSFSPKMSYLPKEMTDRDPDFWTPKPAAAAPARKEEKKP
jgi:hypothetical protein